MLSLPGALAANTGGVAVNRSATLALGPTFPAMPGAVVAGAGGRATAAASLAACCNLAVSCTAWLTPRAALLLPGVEDTISGLLTAHRMLRCPKRLGKKWQTLGKDCG